MYKNFKITEEEKLQILEQHKKSGYGKPLNELGEKDIDLIRGKSDIKYSRSGKQFQQDFEKDFADPSDEFKPYWEKDKPMKSNDFDYDLDSEKEIIRQSEKRQDNPGSQSRDERIKLRRKIASIMSHKEEFGGDELDGVLSGLIAQYKEMEDNR